MSSADKLKSFFKQAELSINPDTDEKIFQDVFDAHQKTIKSKPVQSVNIGRIIMKSQKSKIAAAVLIFAIITVITLFDKTYSFAFADVQASIKQISSMIYQANISMKTLDEEGNLPDMESQSTFLISKEYGMKITMTIDYPSSEDSNSITTEFYFLPKQKKSINIMHNQKIYDQREIPAELTEEANINLMKIIEQVDESQTTSLGKSTLDGIEVEGFRFKDPNIQVGELSISNIDCILWVDVRTQLPVMMEMESLIETQHITGTISDFKWNVPVSADDFEPVIPSDYRSISDMRKEVSELRASLPGYNEEIAIQSLKFFADVSGRYPTELDSITIINEFEQYRRQNNIDTNTIQEMSNGQQTTQLLSEIRFFSKRLERDDKSPAYYGDRVTPDDTNQVLMRWKVSDDEYRIIFGNLETRNVTTFDLARLEENLPEPIAPEDAGVFETEHIPGTDEEIMIEGLKFFADLSGKYPTEPNNSVIIKEFSNYLRQNNDKAREFHVLHREQMKEAPHLELMFFFERLKREGRNPAYYGDIVTPDDASEILMRWKIYDDKYRVIFGNLEPGIVTADDLAGLEENLPKRDVPESEKDPKMRGVSIDIAIEALKLFADMTGHYPIKFNVSNITEEYFKYKRQNDTFINISKEISESRNESELFVELLSFFDRLKRERKDPAYYGDIIIPDDANLVLMRWKISNNDYIVIFGDLEVETVTKETLNLLEKTLPKE